MEPQDTTLLVVDDNEMNRDMLSRRLRRKGYDVRVAEDGETALEIVESDAIDLVLLDIMMPGIDGVEVLKVLRRTYSQTELPVIMATAKAQSEDMVQALDLGANDYVTKPLDFPVVLARVQAQLRTKVAAGQPRSGEPTAAELEPGATLAGKYRLEEEIGAGTFGAVFRARHLDLESDVAVKVLQPSVTASEESQKRFRQEGVAACRVKHPNAVAVSDFGVTETGVAFLVMELLEGVSLAAELTTHVKLSPRRCLEVLGPVCEVLAEAHEAGLVHRDVKPENIFLHRSARGEEVKVLDFGLAKLVGEAVTRENLTAEGWILGTPAYMAPERVSSQTYDGRADVYALGVMLYEMLCGIRPYQAKDSDPMKLIMMHVHAEPPALRSVAPEVSAELEAVVDWAIRKQPAERPDAGQLHTALRAAVDKIATGEAPAAAAAVETGGGEHGAGRGVDKDGSLDHDAPTIALDSAAVTKTEGVLKRWLRKLGV